MVPLIRMLIFVKPFKPSATKHTSFLGPIRELWTKLSVQNTAPGIKFTTLYFLLNLHMGKINLNAYPWQDFPA
jgi:hypothetical protein